MTMAEETESTAAEAKTLGLERWVQFGFVLLAGVTFFIGDKLITLIWSYFAEPNGTIVSGASAIIGILTGYLLYRHPKLNPLAHEVAGELAKVTWPSRKETWTSTVVVIITSIIAAAYLGAFDAIWSGFTDLIYTTS
jgi:preprotein translocase subunit SecE